MLSERLTVLRKENNKTQQQVADYLKITRPAYTAYERGTRQPDYDILQKLADYFDTTTDFLLGREITEQTKEKDIEKVLDDPQLGLWFKEGKQASAANRQRALEFLKFIENQENDRKPGDKQ
ncbi:helix-turn-helix domain-containing protein [Bacillus sp. ISL-46]|uniref:helix-turn-helix domain-containing protein n=1 Tax=Bacillus sp. ISL-46 TaxID=2819129 RepID=UPI001BEB7514|nr:helix-turn-helix transcriptional regulator [Bacillus sp. ISL-46]MBT2722275.1 helix-turn-helix transcriptional regulator [Bacillus sp. ISL-46]